MSRRHVVAVDIGNSNAKIAFQSKDQLVHHSLAHCDSDWAETAIEWVEQNVDCDTFTWLIASVRVSAAAELVQRLSHSTKHHPHRVTRQDVPMEVAVDYPDQLGIDRLLAAFAASQMFRSPVVVVDVGSAITVDFVDQHHCFAGGAILPGPSLQADALHQWTEALPHLGGQLDSPIALPAKNTHDAIRSGIVAGAAGAIDALAARYRSSVEHQATCPIAVTGGHARLIAPHLTQNHHLLPNLVCRGLLDLPRSKRDPAN